MLNMVWAYNIKHQVDRPDHPSQRGWSHKEEQTLQTWSNLMNEDMRLCSLADRDAQDKMKWRRASSIQCLTHM